MVSRQRKLVAYQVVKIIKKNRKYFCYSVRMYGGGGTTQMADFPAALASLQHLDIDELKVNIWNNWLIDLSSDW